MKIEIGGQRKIPNWVEFNNRPDEQGPNFNIITDELPVEDGSVEEFYMSHVIEHIPIPCVESVITKMYNKLKEGGKLRILCPDLEFILTAYLNKDHSVFNNNDYHLGTVPEYYTKLGIGGKVICQFITGTVGDVNDSYLFTARENGEYLCTYSHIGGWDYEMLSNLLKIVGFSKIDRTGIEEMDPHKTKGQLCVNAFK